MMRGGVKNYKYVCVPNNINLNVKIVPSASLKVAIEMTVDNKAAFNNIYKVWSIEKEGIDDLINHYCNNIIAFDENLIQNKISQDKIMPVLYIFRLLKEVRTSGGGLVWKRK